MCRLSRVFYPPGISAYVLDRGKHSSALRLILKTHTPSFFFHVHHPPPCHLTLAPVLEPLNPLLPLCYRLPFRRFCSEAELRIREWISAHQSLVSDDVLGTEMPRPRVKPQDRQRSERACDPCKASKKRCDAGKPCRPCVKKGIHESCTYTSSSRARRSRPGTPPPPVGTNTSEPSRSTIAVGGLTPHSNSIFAAPLGGSNQPPGRLTNGAYLGGDIISPASIQTSTYAGETTRQSYLEDDAESESTDVPSRDTEDSEPATEQRPVMLASSSGDKGTLHLSLDVSFPYKPLRMNERRKKRV